MTDSTTPPPPPSLGNSPSQQNSAVPLGWTPTYEKPLPVMRCIQIKKDGEQCNNWSVRGTVPPRCYRHGSNLPVVKKAAQERVASARIQMMGIAPDMYNVLYELTQPGVEAGIRLKAAQDLLDRAGLKAGMEVNVTVEHVGSPLEEINKRMAIMAGRTVNDFGEVEDDTEDDIIDAEEVDDSVEWPYTRE